jgi:hypothetical protein
MTKTSHDNAPARASKSEPASRGPRACWRSRNINAPCKNCGRYDAPSHAPTDEVGFYCGACCLKCSPQPTVEEVQR